MTSYDAGQWHDLFLAAAGACAALAGLVFVAVSINIKPILQMRGVPERGLHTVLLLLAVVVVSIFGLVPQSVDAFGVELLCTGLVLIGWLASTLRAVVAGARGRRTWMASRLVALIPGSVPYVVAGISVLTREGGGLRWMLVGVIGAVVGAVVNAWVLLVEILR